MHHLVAFLLVFPLAAAIAGILLHGRPLARRLIGVGGALALVVTASLTLIVVQRGGPVALAFGAWPAPFGIVLIADALSAPLVLMTGLVATLGALFAAGAVDDEDQGALFPLLHLMLMGVVGAFLTADLFNLFVWFELMLVASFVLLALGGGRAQLEGAIKYVVLSVISSTLLLFAVALLYRMTGTLSFAELALRVPALEERGLVRATALLFVASFGIKAAVFPLFFWLPAAYHTPPMAVTAVFSALLTKVGVYAFLRVLPLLYLSELELLRAVLLPVAALTMVTGVLGAVAEQDVRRLLAFHIISQIGYMLFGVGLFTASGFAAAAFFVVHIMVSKTALFWMAGAIADVQGSFHLSRLGGLAAARPGMALAFLLPAFSLAGLPPLSGFVGKLALLRAGFAEGRYLVVAVAVVVSLLTLLSMTKIWKEAFWGAPPDDVALRPLGAARAAYLLLPPVAFAALAVLLGVAAGPVFTWFEAAGEELLDPAGYIEAVMGASR